MAQKSLTVAVVSSDRQTREQVASAFENNPRVGALWTLGDYPGPVQLARIREAPSGCVIFLDFSDAIRARRVAAELDQSYPMAATVAVQAGTRPGDLMELMQLGIRESITLPVTAQEADGALERASRKLGPAPEPEKPMGEIHSFLPARPGSGATTIAVHSAAAAARLCDGQTLLIDFDLRLGMTSFLFKLHSQNSVLDALSLSERLEDTLWDQLVSQREGLDVLGSAPIEFDRHVSDAGAGAVLDFALGKYPIICVDLPGEMRPHEIEALHRSKEIFLVCTSEVGTLHMAKRKAEMLHALGINGRVSVILNRAQSRGSMVIGDIEEVLGLPVKFALPPAEAEIMAATQKAVALEGNSPIARQMEQIARRMAGDLETTPSKTRTRGFLEFFSVTPIRDKVRKG